MGVNIGFPITTIPITYEPSAVFNTCGIKEPSRCARTTKTVFERKTETFFAGFIIDRQKAKEAKQKFENLGPLTTKYPDWSESDLNDLKVQFMAFDQNNDGLIDFRELEVSLNELGDTSSSESRRRHFDEIDIDHSDSIDFEEFLEYLYSQFLSKVTGTRLSETIRKMCKTGLKMANVVRALDVFQQMEAGIF